MPAVVTVMAAVEAPVLQLYDAPPLAVKVLLPPEQIVLFPAMLAVGLAFTVSVLSAVAVQPDALVTVTV